MAEACRTVSGQTGTGEGWRVAPAHGGLSLRPQGRARFENFRTEIFGGRSSEADRLQVCRNGCAEMQRGGGRALPPRRAPFGRKESPPWAGVPPDAVRPRLPGDRTARLRRHDPQLRSRFRAIAVCPRGWKRSQDSVSWFLLSPGVVRSSPSSGKCGHPTLVSTRGPCGVGGRAFRGLTRSATEWSAASRKPIRAAALPLSAAISADVKARRLPTSGRRKFPSAEIFEARATLREQSGSTLGRRGLPPTPSPFVTGNEECPHFQFPSKLPLHQRVRNRRLHEHARQRYVPDIDQVEPRPGR